MKTDNERKWGPWLQHEGDEAPNHVILYHDYEVRFRDGKTINPGDEDYDWLNWNDVSNFRLAKPPGWKGRE